MSEDNNDNKNSVTASDLYNNFYAVLNTIKWEMNSDKKINEISDSSASSKVKYLIQMIIAIFILITAKPVIEHRNVGMLIVALLCQRNNFNYIYTSSRR